MTRPATSRLVKLPFSNAIMHSHTQKIKAGQGMGSVLLRTAGGGAGSSYSDIDDYIQTTGINPYSRMRAETTSTGSGMKSLSSKLSKLSIEAPKRKNIVMKL